MNFAEWLTKIEMAATSAIYDGTKSKDFNWEGCPEIYRKKKKRRS